jgi:hypothetical protein
MGISKYFPPPKKIHGDQAYQIRKLQEYWSHTKQTMIIHLQKVFLKIQLIFLSKVSLQIKKILMYSFDGIDVIFCINIKKIIIYNRI